MLAGTMCHVSPLDLHVDSRWASTMHYMHMSVKPGVCSRKKKQEPLSMLKEKLMVDPEPPFGPRCYKGVKQGGGVGSRAHWSLQSVVHMRIYVKQTCVCVKNVHTSGQSCTYIEIISHLLHNTIAHAC